MHYHSGKIKLHQQCFLVKRVLVVAHGNSLRALAKHIIGISDAEIMDFEIPTGQPLVLKLDDKLNYVEHYYL